MLNLKNALRYGLQSQEPQQESVKQQNVDLAIEEFNSKVFGAAEINNLSRYLVEKTAVI